MTLPRRIGGFTVGRRLGSGGGGTVFAATDGDGRSVALKVARRSLPGVRASLRREYFTLARLDHPAVARPVAEGLDDEPCWYAMELVVGRTLRAAGRAVWGASARRRMDAAALAKILDLVCRTCDPLAYLHGEGIVHGDLKPENVLVREDGSPVILDFGLTSRFHGGLDNREELADVDLGGTAAYMAPERWAGESADARSDLYALGVMLFELLTSRLPFRTLEQLQDPELPPPVPSRLVPGVPDGVDRLVAALLARDPRRRIAYAEDVAAALVGLGAMGVRGGTRGRAYLYRARLVGREEPLARLDAWIAAPRRSPPLLVVGEAGVGKTRLAAELAREARRRGIRVVAVSCALSTLVPARPVPPGSCAPRRGGALAELLDAIVDACRDASPAGLAALLGQGSRRAAVLAALAPELGAVAGVAAADVEETAVVIGALVESVVALDRSARLLLIVDDLQWADELTMSLFEALARRRDAPNVLGICRSDGLMRGPFHGVARLEVGELAGRHVVQIALEMLAVSRLSPELEASLVRRSSGNPYVVAETLRAAVSEGHLARRPDRGWQLRPGVGGTLPLPESLDALVAHRLAGLRPSLRRVLELAAIAGRRIDMELLERVTELPPQDLREAVAELAIEQILEEQELDAVAFVHDVVREVVVKGLEPPARRAAHERVARCLEAREDASADLAELGAHWEMAGFPERASVRYAAAARLAASRHAPREAARLFERAIALWPAGREREVEGIELRIELATGVLELQGSRADAAATLRDALARAASIGQADLEARCRAELGRCLARSGALDDARQLLEEALSHHRAAGDRAAEARILGNLANLWKQVGLPERADALYREAIALAEAAGERGILAMNLGNLGNLLHGTQGPDAAAMLHERALSIARDDGAVAVETTHLSSLAFARLAQGRSGEARSLYHQALVLARSVGSRRDEGFLLCALGAVEQRDGRPVAARELYDEALEAARELADEPAEGAVLERLAQLELDEGDPAAAARLLEDALAIARRAAPADAISAPPRSRASSSSRAPEPVAAASPARRGRRRRRT